MKNKFIEFFMFIPFLKRLLVDSDAGESRRVEDLLKDAKIPYRVKTIRSRGNIGMALDSRSYATSNLAMYKGASTPSIVYEIYVRRKDFDLTKELISKKVK